ncbi:MAG: hypothetical protein ABI347_01130 [Nitrososphaera sp.]
MAFWAEYEQYLKKNYNPKTVKDHMQYGIKYADILSTGDAHELQAMSPERRKHIMKSVASLAKYAGCYGFWREIKERYQLKWGSGDSTHIFEEIVNGKNNYKEMLA